MATIAFPLRSNVNINALASQARKDSPPAAEALVKIQTQLDAIVKILTAGSSVTFDIVSLLGIGFNVMTIASNAVTPDLALGWNQEVVLNQATQITINNPVFSSGTIIAGQPCYLYVTQDSGWKPSNSVIWQQVRIGRNRGLLPLPTR